MFFDSWWNFLRIGVSSLAAYISLIILLRTAGKRSLSKMNVFDFVVTVAFGSVLASIVVSKEIAILDGLFAFACLLFLQFAMAWLAVRSSGFNKLIKATPALLAYRGRMLRDAMKNERVNDEEIMAALRSSGVPTLSEATAVVLESDGTLSVITDLNLTGDSVLNEVANFPVEERESNMKSEP
jgi:uncharacterized membrane protein YcaP (DUF421 family)